MLVPIAFPEEQTDDHGDHQGLARDGLHGRIEADPVESGQVQVAGVDVAGFLQGRDAVAGEDDGQDEQYECVDVEEQAQRQA